MKQGIIFGMTGQDAHYLSKIMKDNDIRKTGIARKNAEICGDIASNAFVTRCIKILKPEYIFHLAANSTTQHEALFDNHAAIATGTCNILEAARLHAPHARIFIAGSAMQFVNNGQPIDENTPFAASSPYAAARIYATYLSRYYRDIFGLKVYVGYFFNHDSPMRTEMHVSQKIAQAAIRIAAGSKERLVVGDMSVRKEFMFAGDAVAAAWMLVNQDEVYEAVIGTGRDYSIEEWLAQCFCCVGLNWHDHVSTANGYISEYRRLVSAPTRLYGLGWRPTVSFENLAYMMTR